MSQNNPIGIFDSGIGGLTVAQAIKKALPNESIIYFGDTAHVPYGEKSPELIRRYSKGITEFLLTQNCKAIIIACNTASAHAYQSTRELVESDIPVINVIDPVINLVGNQFTHGKVGIIGTKSTIRSRVYVNRLKKVNPQLEVVSKAAPLLAPMIEEGFYNNNISKTIISSYLKGPRFKNLNALILGCTHYPLIQNEVSEYYQGKIEIFDSSRSTASYLKKLLTEQKLLNHNSKIPDQFIMSDYTKSFEKSATQFFGHKISIIEKRIWDK